MNDTYGPVFSVSSAKAATPEMADERAKSLKEPVHHDMHTHFCATTQDHGLRRPARSGRKAGWNPSLVGQEQTIEELKFANYFKEVTSTATPRLHALPARLQRFRRLVPYQRNESRGAPRR